MTGRLEGAARGAGEPGRRRTRSELSAVGQMGGADGQEISLFAPFIKAFATNILGGHALYASTTSVTLYSTLLCSPDGKPTGHLGLRPDSASNLCSKVPVTRLQGKVLYKVTLQDTFPQPSLVPVLALPRRSPSLRIPSFLLAHS